MAETQKGIQATLFDYFQDTEYFTLQEAEEHVLDHQKRDVNVPSIRARSISMRALRRVSLSASVRVCIPLQGRTSRGGRTNACSSTETAGISPSSRTMVSMR